MLNTSLDVLYIVLAVSVGIFTAFICWGIYYLVRMERNAVYAMEKWTKLMKKADEVLDLAKDKLHGSGAYVVAAANAVKSVVEYAMERKSERKSRKK